MIISRCSQAIYLSVPYDRLIVIHHSPVNMMKVIKNDIEAAGLINAHKNDGIALTKYLYWLEMNVGNQTITELTGSNKLAELRRLEAFSIARKDLFNSSYFFSM